jgi:hypothetical protein
MIERMSARVLWLSDVSLPLQHSAAEIQKTETTIRSIKCPIYFKHYLPLPHFAISIVTTIHLEYGLSLAREDPTRFMARFKHDVRHNEHHISRHTPPQRVRTSISVYKCEKRE